MADDLTVVFRNIADESTVERDATVSKWKRIDFYIGKFGPFTERFPLESFNDAELHARVAKIKATLSNLPK